MSSNTTVAVIINNKKGVSTSVVLCSRDMPAVKHNWCSYNNNNNNNNLIFILRKIHVNMIKCALHESKLSTLISNISYEEYFWRSRHVSSHVMRTDSGSQFVSSEFAEYFMKSLIVQQMSKSLLSKIQWQGRKWSKKS